MCFLFFFYIYIYIYIYIMDLFFSVLCAVRVFVCSVCDQFMFLMSILSVVVCFLLWWLVCVAVV